MRREARDWVLDELGKQPYQAAKPTLLDLIAQQILDWFGDVIDFLSSGGQAGARAAAALARVPGDPDPGGDPRRAGVPHLRGAAAQPAQQGDGRAVRRRRAAGMRPRCGAAAERAAAAGDYTTADRRAVPRARARPGRAHARDHASRHDGRRVRPPRGRRVPRRARRRWPPRRSTSTRCATSTAPAPASSGMPWSPSSAGCAPRARRRPSTAVPA